MKWKYSREKINLWMGSWEVYIPNHMIESYRRLRKGVLATKETKPKKECEHNNISDSDDDFRCMDCGKSLVVKLTPPTPPVSEDKTVEGKIEPKKIRYLNSDLKRWTKEITEAVNHLSSNAKTK